MKRVSLLGALLVLAACGGGPSESENEAAAEDVAAFATPGQTVMGVPSDLVAAVRELIAKHSK